MFKKSKTYIISGVAVLAIGAVVAVGGSFSKPIVYEYVEPEQEHEQIEEPEEVHLMFVGDVMLSRAIGRIMEREEDYTYPFHLIESELRKADIVFGNLENPISDRGDNIGSIYSFRADPRSIEGLMYAHFDVLSIANNHMWDYGREAFVDTLTHVRDAGMEYVGGGNDHGEAHTPVVVENNGQKIAYLAYTNLLPQFLFKSTAEPAVAGMNTERISSDIENIKENNDIDLIVVSFHWGEEYHLVQNNQQESLAYTAIDAGADLIIGHHPHVVQPIEEYKGKYIAYSLGNFVFDQNFDEVTSRGLMLDVVVRDGEVVDITPIDIAFNSSYQPHVVKE